MTDPILMQGDCLETMKDIPDGSIDLILTDPPYGTTQCKWDSVINLELMWVQLNRIIKPKGAMVLTAQQPFTSALVTANVQMFRQSLVWAKNKSSGHLNANRRHMTSHEDILLFSSGQCTFNKQLTYDHNPASYASRAADSSCYNSSSSVEYKGGNTTRNPTTLIRIPVLNNDGSGGVKYHPTQKPIELMEYLIKTYSNEGETVLDFTMGSGTTGVAAKNLNRKFIGIELDQEYFNIAEKRINEA